VTLSQPNRARPGVVRSAWRELIDPGRIVGFTIGGTMLVFSVRDVIAAETGAIHRLAACVGIGVALTVIRFFWDWKSSK